MPRHRYFATVGLLVLATVFAAASPSAGDEWSDFHITVEPTSPTENETFDLRAWRWFPDSGYWPLEQSITISGDQIEVSALIQDQHTRPNSAFLTVMTPGGAFFDDFGPLAAGTYQVNAEIWLTPWPATSGGYLFDSGSRQFTITRLSQDTLVGDYNDDGVVDASDYIVWRKSFGQTGANLTADGNGDQRVDEVDFQMWKGHFGEAMGGGATTSSPAPEPSGVILIAIAVAMGSICRRK